MQDTRSQAMTAEPGANQDGRDDHRIKIHGAEGFEGMRRAGRLAAETLDFITPHSSSAAAMRPPERSKGLSCERRGSFPGDLLHSTCISTSPGWSASIPGERRLDEGDILNIDVTPILDGWHGDSSRMYLVGERIPLKARRLVDVTYEAMMKGIEAIRPGVRIGAIGQAIQRFAEAQRFSVVLPSSR